MNSNKGFVAILIAFVAALSLVVFQTYSYTTASAVKAHQRELRKDELRDYQLLKNYLLVQVDSLQKQYASLPADQFISQTAAKELARREAILKVLSSSRWDTATLPSLKANIENLLELKESLETTLEAAQPRI